MKSSSHILLGKKGEESAADYLRKKGYEILQRNFQKKHGDIDIIALDRDTYVFVEVKTRIGDEFGTPEDAVHPLKIRKLVRSAQYYCMVNDLGDIPMRIDLVSVAIDEITGEKEINHFKNISF